MPTKLCNGVDLYYEIIGDGPNVVFIHGAGGNHLSWWQQIPIFSQSYTCITIDQRGYGNSKISEYETQNGINFVADLHDLIVQLELSDLHLVGQSLGGLTALWFSLKYPGLVKTLTLCDTTGGVSESTVISELQNRRLPPDISQVVLSKSFQQSNPSYTFLYHQIRGLNPVTSLRPKGFVDGSGPKTSDLNAMTIPTLFIVGDEDITMPPHIVQLAQELIPNSRLEIVPGAGHSVYFEKPIIFNNLLMEFLGQKINGDQIPI